MGKSRHSRDYDEDYDGSAYIDRKRERKLKRDANLHLQEQDDRRNVDRGSNHQRDGKETRR